jgi:hypothetical protein
MADFPFPCPILLSLAIVVCSVGCQVIQVQKVYFYNIYVWNCITCKLYLFMFYYKSFKLNLEWIFSWIEIWMKRICWQPTPSNDVYFYFCRFCSYFKKVFSWFLFLRCISSLFYRKGDLLFFFIHHNCFFRENKGSANLSQTLALNKMIRTHH